MGITLGRGSFAVHFADHLRSEDRLRSESVAVLYSSLELYLTMIKPTVSFRRVNYFELNITASFGPHD